MKVIKPEPIDSLTHPGQIDRDAYEPAYAQLANILRRQIAEGAFRPGEVARLALDYGFAHLGRFSQDYRKLFGEPPSQTLRRSRPEVGQAF